MRVEILLTAQLYSIGEWRWRSFQIGTAAIWYAIYHIAKGVVWLHSAGEVWYLRLPCILFATWSPPAVVFLLFPECKELYTSLCPHVGWIAAGRDVWTGTGSETAPQLLGHRSIAPPYFVNVTSRIIFTSNSPVIFQQFICYLHANMVMSKSPKNSPQWVPFQQAYTSVTNLLTGTLRPREGHFSEYRRR